MPLKKPFINLNGQSMGCESSPGHRFQGLWGEERIASELLLKLGIRVSPTSWYPGNRLVPGSV